MIIYDLFLIELLNKLICHGIQLKLSIKCCSIMKKNIIYT